MAADSAYDHSRPSSTDFGLPNPLASLPLDKETHRREKELALKQIYYDEAVIKGRPPLTASDHLELGYEAGYRRALVDNWKVQSVVSRNLMESVSNIEKLLAPYMGQKELQMLAMSSQAYNNVMADLELTIEKSNGRNSTISGSKRKSDAIDDHRPATACESSSATTHASASLPKKAKSTHEQTTKPKAKASSSLAPLRRPTRTDQWYSDETTEVEWDKRNSTRKRQLSHIGYIEETNAGMFAPTPCSQCKHFTRYNWFTKKTENLVCMVYKPETSDKYTVKLSENWRSCSNCWMRGDDCGIVREAKDVAQARGDPMTASVARHYDDEMLTWYANTSGTRPERQSDGSVIFLKD